MYSRCALELSNEYTNCRQKEYVDGIRVADRGGGDGIDRRRDPESSSNEIAISL